MPSELFYFGFEAKTWKNEEVYTEYKPTSFYKFAAKTKI